MEIFHVSAECYPVAKVGGLADVVGALPKYQKKAGHDAKVVMPLYDTKFRFENEYENVHNGVVKLGYFNSLILCELKIEGTSSNSNFC